MPKEEPSATVMTLELSVELSLSVRVRSEPGGALERSGDGGDLSFCERGVGELGDGGDVLVWRGLVGDGD